MHVCFVMLFCALCLAMEVDLCHPSSELFPAAVYRMPG